MSADELDVDAELLAMGGDDDSSDSEGSDAGEIPERPQQIEDRTPSEEPKPSVEKVEEPPSARRGVAMKVRKRGGRKKVSRKEIEDELDDLADSPSPAASLGSDAMAASPESQIIAPPSPIEDGPLYPLEGKFTSATDRDDILALPEIEREAILAERAADELKRQQDLQLKKALAATQAAASKHKRKAAAADLDDGGPRKNSRAKLEKTGRSALDDYKKAREAKGAERTGRFDTKRTGRRDSRSPSSVSDRDADGESEVEWADTTTSTRRDEPPAEMRDFERCRVGRSNFAKVLFYPNFEDTMKGCFCRVSIGLNRETGQNLYRMAQIKSFTHGKPYPLEAPNGKTFTCDIYALVAHGTAEKPWPCSACSDSRFSPEEYQRYIETLQKERLRVPKKGWLEQKLDDIHRFLNPQWDEAQLQGKFTRQREMEKRVDPANAAKAKKDAILKRQAEAEESGDLEEISRCEAELVALDVNASNGTTTTKPTLLKGSPSKPQVQTTQDKLALLNQKNRDKNAADVRKALIADRKKLQAERERAIASAKVAAKAKAEAEAARREAEENGGLLGVPGREAMKEMFGDLSDVSRAGTPMSGVSTPRIRGRSRAGTPMNGVGVGKSKLGLAAKKKDEEDELGGLDLGIDVEI